MTNQASKLGKLLSSASTGGGGIPDYKGNANLLVFNPRTEVRKYRNIDTLEVEQLNVRLRFQPLDAQPEADAPPREFEHYINIVTDDPEKIENYYKSIADDAYDGSQGGKAYTSPDEFIEKRMTGLRIENEQGAAQIRSLLDAVYGLKKNADVDFDALIEQLAEHTSSPNYFNPEAGTPSNGHDPRTPYPDDLLTLRIATKPNEKYPRDSKVYVNRCFNTLDPA